MLSVAPQPLRSCVAPPGACFMESRGAGRYEQDLTSQLRPGCREAAHSCAPPSPYVSERRHGHGAWRCVHRHRAMSGPCKAVHPRCSSAYRLWQCPPPVGHVIPLGLPSPTFPALCPPSRLSVPPLSLVPQPSPPNTPEPSKPLAVQTCPLCRHPWLTSAHSSPSPPSAGWRPS